MDLISFGWGIIITLLIISVALLIYEILKYSKVWEEYYELFGQDLFEEDSMKIFQIQDENFSPE